MGSDKAIKLIKTGFAIHILQSEVGGFLGFCLREDEAVHIITKRETASFAVALVAFVARYGASKDFEISDLLACKNNIS